MREPLDDRRWHAIFYVRRDAAELHMERLKSLTLTILLPSLIALTGCEDLVPHDTQSLLDPNMRRSEVVGIVAGFGTTFAAMPDLIAMLKRRSSAGMNPRMATIMGVFQILWVYYGLQFSQPASLSTRARKNLQAVVAVTRNCILIALHGRPLTGPKSLGICPR